MPEKKIVFTTHKLTPKQLKVITTKKPHVLLRGFPGTAKTYTGRVRAANIINESPEINQLIIVRSNVETRPMGHLPGDAAEKMAPFYAPYVTLFADLKSKKSFKMLVAQKTVEVVPTAFLRGQTFSNAVVLVDEFQNMSGHELETVITRIGENCHLIMCGDSAQSDLRYEKAEHKRVLEILCTMKSVAVFDFDVNDILRSDFVGDYIRAKLAFDGDIPLPETICGN
jgi:phosphate starvation-inducible PhoH-like protein